MNRVFTTARKRRNGWMVWLAAWPAAWLTVIVLLFGLEGIGAGRGGCGDSPSSLLGPLGLGVAWAAADAGTDAGADAGTDAEPSVSVDFYETDLREALNEVATQTGVNIVVGETVQGTVTLSLHDVPLEKALRMMLIGGGYVWRKVDDFYVVGTADVRSPLFATLVQMQTVQLKYLKAGQLRALLPPYYDAYVRGDSGDRVLTITAPPEIVSRFLEDVRRLDQPSAATRQVVIEAIVTEISTEVLDQWGSDLFQWTMQAGQVAKPDWKAILGWQGGALDVQTDVYGLLLSKLRALQAENKAEIKANPRLVVADGSTADLFVGQTQTLVVPTSQSTAQVQPIEAGVTLKVTPRILSSDQVQVTLTPEVSYATDATSSWGSVGNSQFKTPVISRSTLETTVVVGDGQTVAVAQMTLGQQANSEQHVPGLGDLPLLRWLFRSHSQQQASRELVVFVTVKLQ